MFAIKNFDWNSAFLRVKWGCPRNAGNVRFSASAVGRSQLAIPAVKAVEGK